MAIQLRTNPYAGVNPHLQSELQTPGGDGHLSIYSSFHASHIGHLADALNMSLPDAYIAQPEQSLQLTWVEEDYVAARPRPDITVYHTQPPYIATTTLSSQPVTDLVVAESVDTDEDFVSSVVIRLMEEEELGRVVTRIELLSPSNMYGRRGYVEYRKSRNQALQSGVVLVEINYLHEFTPPLLRVPIYGEHENAKSYAVYVSNPRPNLESGPVNVYQADVDELFPLVRVPLLGADELMVDFGAIYDHTYTIGRWTKRIDYAQLPPRFETYVPRDQAVIQAKVAEIAAITSEN